MVFPPIFREMPPGRNMRRDEFAVSARSFWTLLGLDFQRFHFEVMRMRWITSRIRSLLLNNWNFFVDLLRHPYDATLPISYALEKEQDRSYMLGKVSIVKIKLTENLTHYLVFPSALSGLFLYIHMVHFSFNPTPMCSVLMPSPASVGTKARNL